MPLPHLYVDHSVVAHPGSWAPLEEVLNDGKVRLVLSLWNLFEIGSASDKAQQAQRLTFLEGFDPIWILERVDLQRLEVRNFCWKQWCGVTPEPLQVFKRNLSEVEAPHAGSQTRIGLTPTQWINGVNFSKYDPYKKLAPNALLKLQSHTPKEIKDPEIFRAWVKGALPKFDPENRALSKSELADFLDGCEHDQSAFYEACPAMAVGTP